MTEKRTVFLLKCAAASLAYAMTGRVGLFIAYQHGSVTPFWPPSGIGIAAIYLLGYRSWPCIWLAAFALNVATGLTPLAAASVASGNTVEVVLGAAILRAFSGGTARFGRTRDVIGLLVAAMVPTAAAAAWGAASIELLSGQPGISFPTVFGVWWAGDATGALLVTPLVLSWAFPDSLLARAQGRARAKLEWAIVIAFSMLAAYSAFSRQFLLDEGLFHPFAFLPLPFVVWAAARLGPRGASTVSAVVASIAVASTARWSPSTSVAREQVTVLMVFNVVVSVTGLVLGAVVGSQVSAESKLQRRQAQYRALVEALPDLIVRTSRTGQILFAHAPDHGTLKLPRAVEEGAKLADVLPSALVAQALAAIEKNTFLRFESQWFADQETQQIEVRVIPSGPDDFTLLCRDMTDLRRAEAKALANDRLASLGMLAAGVAHEINNPLTFVSANLDMASRLSESPDVSRLGRLGVALDAAKTGVDRIAKIVRDLLRLARADNDLDHIDLHATLDLAIRMAGREIESRAKLSVHYGDLPSIQGSESRLGQVFLNLLVNAAHSFDEDAIEREPEIRVVTRSQGSRVVVEIRDNGSGIAPETLGRIFEPFFTTKPAGVGTGLGLPICQQIVTSMGGEIRVKSKLNEGTSVEVELPITRDRPSRPTTGRHHRVVAEAE